MRCVVAVDGWSNPEYREVLTGAAASGQSATPEFRPAFAARWMSDGHAWKVELFSAPQRDGTLPDDAAASTAVICDGALSIAMPADRPEMVVQAVDPHRHWPLPQNVLLLAAGRPIAQVISHPNARIDRVGDAYIVTLQENDTSITVELSIANDVLPTRIAVHDASSGTQIVTTVTYDSCPSGLRMPVTAERTHTWARAGETPMTVARHRARLSSWEVGVADGGLFVPRLRAGTMLRLDYTAPTRRVFVGSTYEEVLDGQLWAMVRSFPRFRLKATSAGDCGAATACVREPRCQSFALTRLHEIVEADAREFGVLDQEYERLGLCGEVCAYVMRRLLGREASFVEIMQHISPEAGMSLEELRTAIRSGGDQADWRTLSADELLLLENPFVLLRDGSGPGSQDHLVVCANTAPGVLLQFDYPRGFAAVPVKKVVGGWGGRVLVVGSDLGRVDSPRLQKAAVAWAGAGAALIVACGCGVLVLRSYRRKKACSSV